MILFIGTPLPEEFTEAVKKLLAPHTYNPHHEYVADLIESVENRISWEVKSTMIGGGTATLNVDGNLKHYDLGQDYMK